MRHGDVSLHNVPEAVENGGGLELRRVPEAVRTELNEGARERMRYPAGVEVRFVPSGPADVTLSTATGEAPVAVSWGPFRERDPVIVGEEPRTIEVGRPEAIERLDSQVAGDLRFSPDVCRIVLPGDHRGQPITYHGTDGDVRPPGDGETPDRTYLAYGTSITEGEAPSGEHLTYPAQVARRLGTDLINLGACGSAYADAAMADHVAGRGDWDLASLALSVNMVGTFDVETFRERATNMVTTVAEANPEAPVATITLYPYGDDLRTDGDADVAASFRAALREVAREAPENVHLIEGPDLLDIGGLTTDLVHPGDDGMITIGERLADRLQEL